MPLAAFDPAQDTLLSATRTALALGITQAELLRAVHSGRIAPTARIGKVLAFAFSRLPELRAALVQPALPLRDAEGKSPESRLRGRG
ncbi:MAG: hypothetical protein ABMA13_01180 [Chthoniobacteraceae bacterium]